MDTFFLNQVAIVTESCLGLRHLSAVAEEDALHIGIAAAQGVNYLLTWNFKHINNAETRSAIHELVESYGYMCPQLCSPEELGGISNG